VEVLPAFHPELSPNEPGDAPGAVTLLLIPRYDPAHPDAPVPDQSFLNTVCDYLDTRRLVTSEVFLRPPAYKPIWVSVGIRVVAGFSQAEVREAVKQRLLQFLSPLPSDPDQVLEDRAALFTPPLAGDRRKGWPLRTPVIALELLAEAGRVPGVMLIKEVQIAEGGLPSAPQISMRGLELPRVAGLSVNVGDAIDLNQLRGQGTPQPTAAVGFLPVPVIPEECN